MLIIFVIKALGKGIKPEKMCFSAGKGNIFVPNFNFHA